jgi:glucose-6-phosphate isomerase
MLETERAFRNAGLDFGRQAVAVTSHASHGSELGNYAEQNHWLKTFSMWDWEDRQTSEISAVGLLPGSFAGIRYGSIQAGLKTCDDKSLGVPNLATNPAAQLELAWVHSVNDK